MTNLNEIISSFSIEEQKQFISYLEQRNKRKDAKNTQLFKLIAHKKLSTSAISKKLYKYENKEALYALRKRLYQSVIDFIANKSLDDDDTTEIHIIKYILAARTFFIKGQYSTGYEILSKAESIADEHQLYTLLNEIYHTQIQYAYTQNTLKIDAQVEKFKHNQHMHQLDEELNIAYAKIRTAIRAVTYKGSVIDFETLVNDIFKEHHIKIDETFSFKSLYQLITIVSLSAFATKDYFKVEPFLLSKYQILKDHKSKEKQLYYHIHVLYNIANTLFRNKKFEESMQYLKLMHTYMLSKQRKYYPIFKLKYNLLLGLNLNYNNRLDKAIKVFSSFVSKKHPDLGSLLDIYLSLIMCYFQKGSFIKAMRLFSQFYHTDNWYTEKAGKEWTIKKNLIEILLHLELGNIDLFESRLLSFKRSHFQYLKDIQQERAIVYLSLVESYYKTPQNISSTSFKEKVENSFTWISVQEEDIFVMSFYAWLKSKMDATPLYETTLGLIHKTN